MPYQVGRLVARQEGPHQGSAICGYDTDFFYRSVRPFCPGLVSLSWPGAVTPSEGWARLTLQVGIEERHLDLLPKSRLGYFSPGSTA